MQQVDRESVVEQLRNPKERHTAFAWVVTHYSEMLYWHIRKLVVSHDDADDILQNCFVKAWVNIEGFRGDAKLTTWLYRIATNESLTFLEQQRKRQHLSGEENDLYLADKLESDAWFDGDELQRNLQEAVLSLPDKQRLVFNMKYFDEMKYEEISEILGTSVGALKASYHHASKRVEQYISERS